MKKSWRDKKKMRDSLQRLIAKYSVYTYMVLRILSVLSFGYLLYIVCYKSSLIYITY